MYEHILVPTDGSDHARRAAEHATLLAEGFDATVHLLAVVDIEAAAGPFSAGGVDDEYVDQRTAAQRTALSDLADSLDYSGAVETTVVTGTPAEGILDYARNGGADLVVMGTHGRSGLRRYLTGSVAERVVRLSPVPVLTVRATEASAVGEGYDDILLPTDGSERAAAAVAPALAVADAFGSTVHVVSVVNVGDIATGAETSVPAELLDELEDAAADATAAVASETQAAGVDAVTDVWTGRPKHDLLEYVDDHDIEMVVMGTHGRTGLERVLLGSTAEALVRRAEVPVMTVGEERD
ncbi:universal stress protein [Haloarcula onubensis]|uniref:Universal stress protein n=1 Tax=Haloarcula onubensis TaxID=2950539 RepID=A0ABU2FQ41_9EURY|nr:universal stress protein [Halomicroarcula sp. S3CR25-11]MDS0282864.1 universal stress protein [Halomicroarcula sp. S3CR25-11]